MCEPDDFYSVCEFLRFNRESFIPGNFVFAVSVCRLRERGCMSKSVYVCVFHDLELLRYVLCCGIKRQL